MKRVAHLHMLSVQFFFEFVIVTLTHLVYKITLFTPLTLRYSNYTALTSLQC